MQTEKIIVNDKVDFEMYKDHDFVVRDYYNGWERNSLRAWNSYARQLPHMSLILDIGAYTGIYSFMAAKFCADSDIIAFEPVPPVNERLCRNIDLNRSWIADRENFIMPFSYALTEKDGLGEINITGGSVLPSGSSVDPHPNKATIKTYNIVTRSGDSVLKQHELDKPLKLLKLDVERHELAALKGLAGRIESDKPICFIELLSVAEYTAVYDLMKQLGYNQVFQISEDQTPYFKIVGEEVTIGPKTTNFIFRVQ